MEIGQANSFCLCLSGSGSESGSGVVTIADDFGFWAGPFRTGDGCNGHCSILLDEKTINSSFRFEDMFFSPTRIQQRRISGSEPIRGSVGAGLRRMPVGKNKKTLHAWRQTC